MGSKATTIVNGDERPAPIKRPGSGTGSGIKLFTSVADQWREFSRFLADVRGEMRKVVTPSRKEVEATTTVVIIAVFIFGVYFFVVDAIFDVGLHQLLGKLGGF
jgi:preprotein translocase subunit SecE